MRKRNVRFSSYCLEQGITKRYRLSWLTNNVLVYDPKWVGGGGGVSANEDRLQGAQINFGNITLYLTYD
jgi:hypothetical protein